MVLKKIFYFIISVFLVFLPVGISILAWMLLKPIDFWQKALLILIAAILFGKLQCFLVMVGIFFWINLFYPVPKEWSNELYEKEKKSASFINRIKNIKGE